MNFIQDIKNNRNLIIAFTILIVVALIRTLSGSTPTPQTAEPDSAAIDTIIPQGYVLVPISLVNHDIVSSMIKDFGMIDLYSGSPDKQGTYKIAQRIKLLRAPYNPNLFAVLVKDDFAKAIMNAPPQLYAVVQNQSLPEGNNEIKPLPLAKKIEIEYQY